MAGYVGRRLLLAAGTLLGLSMLIFLLGSLAGDPTDLLAARGNSEGQDTASQLEIIRNDLGLNRPLPLRYLDWLSDAVRGDLGRSLFTGRSVAGLVGLAFPATLGLAVVALVLIVSMGLTMGVVSALFHRHWEDQVVRIAVLVVASIPGFFLAYVLVNIFAVRLQLLPTSGTKGLRSLVLPAFTLAVGPAATVARLLRSSLLDVLGEEYIRTARGKGLAALPVMVNHAVRNASLPVFTVIASVFGRLLEGAVIVEVVFNRTGVGYLTYNAVVTYDYPVVIGAVLCGGVVFVVLNLLVDLTYGIIDPRVRVGASA